MDEEFAKLPHDPTGACPTAAALDELRDVLRRAAAVFPRRTSSRPVNMRTLPAAVYAQAPEPSPSVEQVAPRPEVAPEPHRMPSFDIDALLAQSAQPEQPPSMPIVPVPPAAPAPAVGGTHTATAPAGLGASAARLVIANECAAGFGSWRAVECVLCERACDVSRRAPRVLTACTCHNGTLPSLTQVAQP